jgi:hypothetical protein
MSILRLGLLYLLTESAGRGGAVSGGALEPWERAGMLSKEAFEALGPVFAVLRRYQGECHRGRSTEGMKCCGPREGCG